MHSGDLQSWATDFGSRNPLIGLWVYTLRGSGGLQSLAKLFWISQTTHWTGGLHFEVLHSEVYNLGNRICISQPTHWTRGLHFKGLYSGSLQHRATDFRARNPLIGLGVYTLGAYSGGLQSRATDFGSRNPLIGPGVYTLEGCIVGIWSLGHPILDLVHHSPVLNKKRTRNLHTGCLQVGGLESRATDFRPNPPFASLIFKAHLPTKN